LGELVLTSLHPLDPLDKDALVTPKDDEIQKILNSLGVKYTHNNEAILKPTKVENKLGLEAIKVCSFKDLRFLSSNERHILQGKRKARDKAKITLANETVPIPSRSKRRGSDWPPKRHVKDANPSPDARFVASAWVVKMSLTIDFNLGSHPASRPCLSSVSSLVLTIWAVSPKTCQLACGSSYE
jgi:hypothetical protein